MSERKAKRARSAPAEDAGPVEAAAGGGAAVAPEAAAEDARPVEAAGGGATGRAIVTLVKELAELGQQQQQATDQELEGLCPAGEGLVRDCDVRELLLLRQEHVEAARQKMQLLSRALAEAAGAGGVGAGTGAAFAAAAGVVKEQVLLMQEQVQTVLRNPELVRAMQPPVGDGGAAAGGGTGLDTFTALSAVMREQVQLMREQQTTLKNQLELSAPASAPGAGGIAAAAGGVGRLDSLAAMNGVMREQVLLIQQQLRLMLDAFAARQ